MRRSGRGSRIYLWGFMGSGKSTVARALSRLRGVPAIDLDRRIEDRAGLRIPDLFERRGEAVFRQLETECLREVAAESAAVIAVGGGTPLAEENQAIMKSSGRSIWLDVPFEVLQSRMSRRAAAERPLWTDPEAARDLFLSRRSAYARAGLTIQVESGVSAADLAARLDLHLRETSPCDI